MPVIAATDRSRPSTVRRADRTTWSADREKTERLLLRPSSSESSSLIEVFLLVDLLRHIFILSHQYCRAISLTPKSAGPPVPSNEGVPAVAVSSDALLKSLPNSTVGVTNQCPAPV